MGKRGAGRFRKLDVERAIRSARSAGLKPTMIEIELPDGTVLRVHADNVAPATDTDTAAVKAWDAAIAELKAAPKGGKGQ